MSDSTAVRLPTDFLNRADQLLTRLRAHPELTGHLGTRAALLRLACVRGLAALEADLAAAETRRMTE